MKDYEDEAFDELEKAQQRKVATGVTDGSKTEANSTLSALKLALEVLKNTRECDAVSYAITALEEALAKQDQGEPVGEVINERGDVDYISYVPPIGTNLYTTPQQRKPLTNEVLVPLEILEAAESSLGAFCSDHGWSDQDMQNMDNLSAYIAQHKAAHGIKE